VSNCAFEILAESESGYVGRCTDCGEFNFAFKNLLITFTEEHLFHFHDWLIENQNDPDFIFELPNGKSRVYRSPVDNLFIAFHPNELGEIHDLMVQTQLILVAKRLLNPS
jgi:hypothetical protein